MPNQTEVKAQPRHQILIPLTFVLLLVLVVLTIINISLSELNTVQLHQQIFSTPSGSAQIRNSTTIRSTTTIPKNTTSPKVTLATKPASPNTLIAGNTITFNAFITGNNSPIRNYTFYIYKATTKAKIKFVTTTSNSYVFATNTNLVGNTLDANVFVTDNSGYTFNSVLTGIFIINATKNTTTIHNTTTIRPTTTIKTTVEN